VSRDVSHSAGTAPSRIMSRCSDARTPAATRRVVRVCRSQS